MHTWHAPVGVIVQPPAVRQAKGERQEVGLRGELVGDDDAAPPQERLSHSKEQALYKAVSEILDEVSHNDILQH